MSRIFNGSALNTGGIASWVRSAAVLATATAVSVAAVATNVGFGIASAVAETTGTATASVTLAAAKARGDVGVASYAAATLNQAMQAHGQTESFGLAAVRREVFGQAMGEATATGLAIPASLLGDAVGEAGGSVVRCDGHIVFFEETQAYTVTTGEATANGVNRGAKAAGSPAVLGIAEASLRLALDDFYQHDGFVNAPTVTTGTVSNDGTLVRATLGSFAFTTSDGAAVPHIVHPGRAHNEQETVFGMLGEPQFVYWAHASGQATPSGTATGQRTRAGAAMSEARAYSLPIRGIDNNAGHVDGHLKARGTAVAVRTVFGAAFATETITAGAVIPAEQWYLSARADTETTAKRVKGDITFAGQARGDVEAIAAPATPAEQWYAEAEGVGEIIPAPLDATFIFGGRAYGDALAVAEPLVLATQWYVTAQGEATIEARPLVVLNIIQARAVGDASAAANVVTPASHWRADAHAEAAIDATPPLATIEYSAEARADIVTTGSANSFTASDLRAPADRQLAVSGESRAMAVPAENRTMEIQV